MPIFVTGATGNVGSTILQGLQGAGHQVTVLFAAKIGVLLRESTVSTGSSLNLLDVSVSSQKVCEHLGWLAKFAQFDTPVLSSIMQGYSSMRFGWVGDFNLLRRVEG
jgi:nucleoside-diphosphate-sugar epimerase